MHHGHVPQVPPRALHLLLLSAAAEQGYLQGAERQALLPRLLRETLQLDRRTPSSRRGHACTAGPPVLDARSVLNIFIILWGAAGCGGGFGAKRFGEVWCCDVLPESCEKFCVQVRRYIGLLKFLFERYEIHEALLCSGYIITCLSQIRVRRMFTSNTKNTLIFALFYYFRLSLNIYVFNHCKGQFVLYPNDIVFNNCHTFNFILYYLVLFSKLSCSMILSQMNVDRFYIYFNSRARLKLSFCLFRFL